MQMAQGEIAWRRIHQNALDVRLAAKIGGQQERNYHPE